MRRFRLGDADVRPEHYETYIEQHQTWNFCVNFLDMTFFNLAMSFIFGTTVLALYTSYLATSAVLIGLIPALQNVSFFWPQLITSRLAERLPRKKPFMIRISVAERVPYIFVAALALLWPGAPRMLAYWALAFSLLLAASAGGLGAPAWKGMLAKVIPVNRRGRLFGLSGASGGLLGIAGAALSRRVLANYPYPVSFGICFGLCFLSQAISWAFVAMVREPPRQPTRVSVPARDYMRRLPAILREDRNFSRYLIARTLLILGQMGTTFYVVFGRTALGASDAFAANLTMVAVITQMICTPLAGWLADMRGNKLITVWGGVISVVGVVIAFLATSEAWLYGVFVAVNAANAAFFISSVNMTMEFGAEEELPTYTALGSTVLALPILVAPIIGGLLVDAFGYHALFGVSLAFLLVGSLAMSRMVREPRHEPRPGMATQDAAVEAGV
jgi:MFS family permease